MDESSDYPNIQEALIFLPNMAANELHDFVVMETKLYITIYFILMIIWAFHWVWLINLWKIEKISIQVKSLITNLWE